MDAPRKKWHKRTVERVVFDEEARKEFVTGFHKRKEQRREQARIEAEAEAKAARRQARSQSRKERLGQLKTLEEQAREAGLSDVNYDTLFGDEDDTPQQVEYNDGEQVTTVTTVTMLEDEKDEGPVQRRSLIPHFRSLTKSGSTPSQPKAKKTFKSSKSSIRSHPRKGAGKFKDKGKHGNSRGGGRGGKHSSPRGGDRKGKRGHEKTAK